MCARTCVYVWTTYAYILAYEKNSDEAVGMKVSAWGFKKDNDKKRDEAVGMKVSA